MLKVYVSGPMTNMPNFNFPLFNEVAEKLRSYGYDVENPADKGIIEEWTWSDYLVYDLEKMLDCDAIIQLPGWENSKGAVLENKFAKRMQFIYLSYAHLNHGVYLV